MKRRMKREWRWEQRQRERESERSAENGMNECQTCIFKFQRQKPNLLLQHTLPKMTCYLRCFDKNTPVSNEVKIQLCQKIILLLFIF